MLRRALIEITWVACSQIFPRHVMLSLVAPHYHRSGSALWRGHFHQVSKYKLKISTIMYFWKKSSFICSNIIEMRESVMKSYLKAHIYTHTHTCRYAEVSIRKQLVKYYLTWSSSLLHIDVGKDYFYFKDSKFFIRWLTQGYTS